MTEFDNTLFSTDQLINWIDEQQATLLANEPDSELTRAVDDFLRGDTDPNLRSNLTREYAEQVVNDLMNDEAWSSLEPALKSSYIDSALNALPKIHPLRNDTDVKKQLEPDPWVDHLMSCITSPNEEVPPPDVELDLDEFDRVDRIRNKLLSCVHK